MQLRSFLLKVYVPSRLELSRESVRQMEITVRVFERWAGRPLSLADFSEPFLRQFLSAYRLDHSPATTNSKRCQLLALWQCAWEEELLEQPPRRSKIRKAKARRQIPEAWNTEEVGRIVTAARQDRKPIGEIPAPLWWESLLLVMYDTGERRSAVFATAPEHLSLPDHSIIFHRTKTGQPRWCRLHADTIQACRRIWRPERSLLWPWPWTREALDKRFRKILQRAGVSFGRARGGLFHKLRRTTGTLIEAAGGDGAKAIGNTRRVFEQSYRDPRFFRSDMDVLPRPKF